MRSVQFGTSSGGVSGGSASWDTLSGKPELYSYFALWAEEKGDLSSATYEWGFGSGSTMTSSMGATMPFDCALIALNLTTSGAADCEVALTLDEVESGKVVTTVSAKNALNLFEDDPLVVTAGQRVNFRTLIGSGDSNGGTIIAWFRRRVA